jgi:hypothetical protein
LKNINIFINDGLQAQKTATRDLSGSLSACQQATLAIDFSEKYDLYDGPGNCRCVVTRTGYKAVSAFVFVF